MAGDLVQILDALLVLSILNSTFKIITVETFCEVGIHGFVGSWSEHIPSLLKRFRNHRRSPQQLDHQGLGAFHSTSIYSIQAFTRSSNNSISYVVWLPLQATRTLSREYSENLRSSWTSIDSTTVSLDALFASESVNLVIGTEGVHNARPLSLKSSLAHLFRKCVSNSFEVA